MFESIAHALAGQYATRGTCGLQLRKIAEFPKRETIPHLECNTKKLFLGVDVQLNNASSHDERKARCDASAAACRGQLFAARPKLPLIVISFYLSSRFQWNSAWTYRLLPSTLSTSSRVHITAIWEQLATWIDSCTGVNSIVDLAHHCKWWLSGYASKYYFWLFLIHLHFWASLLRSGQACSASLGGSQARYLEW